MSMKLNYVLALARVPEIGLRSNSKYVGNSFEIYSYLNRASIFKIRRRFLERIVQCYILCKERERERKISMS